jgi:hypothetical protein
MNPAVLTFRPDGTITGLYAELIPLDEIGELEISRATSIEFNNTQQVWEVRNEKGDVIYQHRSGAQWPICRGNWMLHNANCVTCGSSVSFKKNTGDSLRTVLQRYERIHAMKEDHPILTLCFHLEVSASGYYDWQKRRACPGARDLENQSLSQVIDQIHTRSRKTYGAPRVEKEL